MSLNLPAFICNKTVCFITTNIKHLSWLFRFKITVYKQEIEIKIDILKLLLVSDYQSRKMSQIKCNVPNDQLSADEFQQIESRMYPGQYSQEGFLQPGEKLQKVIDTDAKFLTSVGITYDQIADRLDTIIGKYYRLLNLAAENGEKSDQIIVESKYQVSRVGYMGAQECPFQNQELDKSYHGYEYGSNDFTISNLQTGHSFTFNTLLIHLILDHHFFESPKSSHRLDPAQVISMLDIKPNVVYTPNYRSYVYWQFQGGSTGNDNTDKEIQFLSQVALKTYLLGYKVIGFLLPTHRHEYKFRKMAKSIPIDSSLTYEAILPDLCSAEIKLLQECKFRDDDVVPSQEELMNQELAIINEYRTTGKLDNLWLYVCSARKIDQTFMIENMKCRVDWETSWFRLRTQKYVPISAAD